jgi:hypothetical protein
MFRLFNDFLPRISVSRESECRLREMKVNNYPWFRSDMMDFGMWGCGRRSDMDCRRPRRQLCRVATEVSMAVSTAAGRSLAPYDN